MDAEPVRRVPRLRAAGRSYRRVQWQMDVGPVGAPRRLVRDPTVTRATQLSQLLPVGCSLAIHRHSVGGARMTTPLRSTPLRAGDGASRELRDDVLRGLLGAPKT